MTHQHVFHKGNNPELPTLLLLHGTGGNERDLLPLAEMISPDSSVLSVRGNVLEDGMPRFFRRLQEGVFDEEDLVFRTNELYQFINQAAKQYQFDPTNLVAVGYSNGANIAGSLLFHFEKVFAGAILHHPMVPLRGLQLPSMKGIPIFIGAGRNDFICPPHETEELVELLNRVDAQTTLYWENFGHQLTATEVQAAVAWFELHLKNKR